MYYCTCKSLWIKKASVGKLGVNAVDEANFNVNHVVLNEAGKLIQHKLNKASEEMLNNELSPYLDQKCKEILDYSSGEVESSEENNELVESTLQNMEILESGRLVVALTWKGEGKSIC